LALATALFVTASATAAPGNDPRPRGTNTGALRVGVAPPALDTHRITGPDPVDLTRLQGRVVILDFWATWCGPCQAVMPLLDGLHQRYHDEGLTVLGISSEPEQTITSHLGLRPVGYTMARDLGETSPRFGVTSVPTLVVVGRDGKVKDVLVGVSGPRMRALVDSIPRLLDERP
jgi:thiol-disulfide isomerase/thioredoxin